MQALRRNTATVVNLGPLISKTDGVTPISDTASANLGSATGNLYLNGDSGTPYTPAGSVAVVGSEGECTLTLTPAMLPTAGRLRITLTNSGTFLPIREKFTVLPEQVYDSLVGGTDYLRVDVVQLAGSAANVPDISQDTSAGSLQQEGFLGRVIALVRKSVDAPNINAKYVDADLVSLLCAAWTQVWADLSLTEDNPLVVRLDLAVVAGTMQYVLPPTIGEILRLSKVNSVSGLADWEIMPRSRYNPAGPGFTIEGNMVTFLPIWTAGDTLRIEYIPSGEVVPHQGLSLGSGASTLDLATAPSKGVMERRPNGLLGYPLRVWCHNSTGAAVAQDAATAVIQERIIGTFDHTVPRVTVLSPFVPALTGSGHYYEVVPVFGRLLESVLSLRIARTILANEGNKARSDLQTKEYAEQMRSLHIHVQQMQGRLADRFEGDTSDNPRYGLR